VWIVEPVAYNLPIATTRGGSPTNILPRYEICVCSSSFSSSSSSSAQLSFVLTLPRASSCYIGSASSCCIGLCCCVMPMEEITCSISRLISSLISLLNSSLILASWSCVAGVQMRKIGKLIQKIILPLHQTQQCRHYQGVLGC